MIVSDLSGKRVCGRFVDAQGKMTAGWLPRAALAIREERAGALSDWFGVWVRVEAGIDVERAAGGRLKIKGNATWGASDAERAKIGAINVGEIDFEAAPLGNLVQYGTNAAKPLAYATDGTSGCEVFIRRLEHWLLIADNMNCGGVNVSFQGVYVKSRAR